MARLSLPSGAGHRVGAAALVTIAAAIFIFHATAYGDWLIDDSGISFAYAINLAHGRGLVSQAGATPVEGYSNPLWVLLLAVLSAGGHLSFPIAPKLLSGVFVVSAYAFWIAILDRIAVHPRLVAAAVLVAASLNPSVVIWCMSGLENGLYVFLITVLLYATLTAIDAARPEASLALCGVVVSLAAMTRPDGAIFALVPPVAMRFTRGWSPRSLVVYGAAFGAIFGSFLAVRLWVFHALVPNTAIVKGGPGFDQAIDLLLFSRDGVDKLDRLLEAAFPAPVTNVVFVATILGYCTLYRRGHLGRGLGVLTAFMGTSLLAYMLMPADWMREYRFATPFFPLGYAWVFAGLDAVIQRLLKRRWRAAFVLVASALVAMALPVFAGRARAFALNSNISLFFVRRAFAERFDRYAAALHVEQPSALLPDVGGMLLWSRARVYDLAGLCDRRIARAWADDPETARDYILGDARPTLIHLYGKYSRVALERDARFERDYVPIHVYTKEEDPDLQGHASGVFVRKDALSSDDEVAALDAIRHEDHKREDLVEPVRPSALLRWLLRTPIVPKSYRAPAPMVIGQEAARAP